MTYKKGFDPKRHKGGKMGRSCRKDIPCATTHPRVRDITWAAGFLEGEGSFKNTVTTSQVRAAQVQREPLERLQALFGGSISLRHDKRPTNSPIYVWSVSGTRARGVLLTLFTLMSPKRKEQIRKGL
jgi:hypothetical protein